MVVLRSVGNILGVFGASALIVSLGVKWEYCMLLFAALTLFVTLKLSFTLLQHENYHPRESEATGSQMAEVSECGNYVEFMKRQLTSVDFILYVSIFSLLKVIVYTLLLWLPIYMQSEGESSE